MATFPQTIILRHQKENIKKCSLQGLEHRKDFKFFSYPNDLNELPSLERAICLSFDGPLLTSEDQKHPLLIIDATWTYAAKMKKRLQQMTPLMKRSLPKHLQTAYPRVQNGCSQPHRGLASIEAIFVAYTLLGRETEGLLDHYYWKELFLQKQKSATVSYLSQKKGL